MKKRHVFLLAALTLLATASLAFAGRPVAQATPGLDGVRWVLVSYRAANGGVTPAVSGVEATAEFKAGRVAGSTGCNQYSASYQVGNNTFSIGPGISTKMACILPGVMEQETAFLTHLEGVRGYWVQSGRLTLHDAQGAVELTFQAGPTGSPTAGATPGAAITATSTVTPTAGVASVSIDVSAGLLLDPTFVSVNGGGAVDAGSLHQGCAGFVNRQPVVTVKYGGQAAQVRAFFVSDADPTLVVQTPTGEWLCNDNATAQLRDPFVEVLNPAGGEYRIWVGSAAKSQLIPGILVLTTQPTVDLGTFDVSKFITRPLIPQVAAQPLRALKAAPQAQAQTQIASLWRVDYFGNPDWAGAPASSQYVGAVAFNWGSGSPSPNIAADNFTARLSTETYFYAGTYNFSVLADDEFALFIDGGVIRDTRGQGQSGKTTVAPVAIAQGYHRIEVLYREWTQAAYLTVNWALPNTATPTPGQAFPTLPTSVNTVQTKFGNFTPCRQQGLHQANCFVSDGAWNSPNLGSIQLEPPIQVWRPCAPADQVMTFYVNPQTPQKDYKCSKTLAGWFAQ